MTNKEILTERINKTKNTLNYSAALYQDEVILCNQIAIMETLIQIQDSITNEPSTNNNRVNGSENKNK